MVKITDLLGGRRLVRWADAYRVCVMLSNGARELFEIDADALYDVAEERANAIDPDAILNTDEIADKLAGQVADEIIRRWDAHEALVAYAQAEKLRSDAMNINSPSEKVWAFLDEHFPEVTARFPLTATTEEKIDWFGDEGAVMSDAEFRNQRFNSYSGEPETDVWEALDEHIQHLREVALAGIGGAE